MSTSETFKIKSEMLAGTGEINQDIVCERLGLQPGSANNLLSLWERAGILLRVAPGAYLSTSAFPLPAKAAEFRIAKLRIIKSKLGGSMILVGQTAWELYGWCKTGSIVAAVPVKPSGYMPKVLDGLLIPVGVNASNFLLSQAIRDSALGLHYLNPVAQMLWWMEADCKVPMPSPNDVNWKEVLANEELAAAVDEAWPEFKKSGVAKVEGIYEMLYMDRLNAQLNNKPAFEEEVEPETAHAPH
jgi:hypothetical protein